MSSPNRRRARLLAVTSVVAGLVGSATLVWHASYSAFTSTTTNPGNSWSAGSVVLTDDDSGSAMFTPTGMKPGSTGTHCIAVTSTGNLASTVKLYGATYSTTNSLATYLDVTVTQGTGGTFASCTGFTPLGSGSSVYSGTLAAFAAASTNFATGQGSWAPTGSGSDTRVFQFVYTLQSATPNSAQGGTAAIGFTWEAQNS